ncbi:MAG TPA: HD domain-containing phosphohydrolase [Gaiellales bacterium]|nr:HD domain-containing phosphohydrolase [Gaiellales bacterium]
MNDKLLHPSRILVVDDQEANALLLQAILVRTGYTAVETMTDPLAVVARCAEEPPDLLLLDWHMPGCSGPDILEEIGFLTEEPNWMPVLVLTADIAPDTKRRALSLGARDFLTKPIDVPEVLLRVRNLLQNRYLRVELQRNNDLLHERVSQRTRELEDAKLEMLDRLALAAEYRDDATGQHAERIGRTSELLALALDLPPPDAALMGQAARLHDIGKIGIADDLLLKPGKYTVDEYAAMKLHPAIGARILSGSTNELLMMAEQIALTHHERWDGRGYPSGLAGEAIPLPGRIVSVADVFDALTHRRPYKEPWPVPVAVREILSETGTKFDPRVTEAFAKLDHPTLVQPAKHGARAAVVAVDDELTLGRGQGANTDAEAA